MTFYKTLVSCSSRSRVRKSLPSDYSSRSSYKKRKLLRYTQLRVKQVIYPVRLRRRFPQRSATLSPYLALMRRRLDDLPSAKGEQQSIDDDKRFIEVWKE